MTKQDEVKEPQNIHEAILSIMEEVEYIQKEKVEGAGYKGKKEQAVLEAVRPAMIKNKVIMLPINHSLIEHSTYENTKVNSQTGETKTTTWHRTEINRVFALTHVPSMTSVTIEALGVGSDYGDKDANGAMTVAKKYALLEAFLIVTGDDPDNKSSGNGQSSSGGQTKSKEKCSDCGAVDSHAPDCPSAEKKVQVVRPLSPADLKVYIEKIVKKYPEPALSDKQRQVLAASLNKVFELDEDKRHTFLKWITGKASTKDISKSRVSALLRWLGVSFFDDEINKFAIIEAQAAYTVALKEEGQTEMDLPPAGTTKDETGESKDGK